MSYKITPKINSTDSKLLDQGTITGPVLFSYDPQTKDFSLQNGAPAFIASSIIYVDPNGNDTTGQFGSITLPFKTPAAALFAAAAYMAANSPVSVPTGMISTYGFYNAVDVSAPRIKIEVLPGVYDSGDDKDWYFAQFGTTLDFVNLMYNYIDWYFHPGAIMYDYYFFDGNNIVDASVLKPVICNVYGEGTFYSPAASIATGAIIYIEDPETILNFQAVETNITFYVVDGILNYNVKKQIAGEYSTGYSHGQEGGLVNMNIEAVKWRLDNSTYSVYFMYQSGGTFNANIKRYSGIYTDSNIPGALANITAGTTMTDWDTNVIEDKTEDYAPFFGYFEEIAPSTKPTFANININFGKFFNSVLLVDSGTINLYPGNLYLTRSLSYEGGTIATAIVGGPYYVNAVSKFSMYGGKIYFYNSTGNNAEGVEILDDPQIYVKDTQFVFDSLLTTVFGVAYYGPSPGTYQEKSVILDGVKIATGSTAVTGKYTFLVDGDTNLDVKIYGNCFSNLNPVGSSGGSYTNLVPGTSLVIDTNIQII